MSEDHKTQFYIPEGFAHGFLVLSDIAEFCYKVSDFWHPNDEGGVLWNDPDIHIQWPSVNLSDVRDSMYTFANGSMLNINEKDKKLPMFKEAFKF